MSEEKPESMISAEVQQVLIKKINEEIEKTVKDQDDVRLSELARAKKLVKKGCWTVRKANKYLGFMSQCMVGKGGTLEETQKAMKECGQKWSKMPDEQRKKLLETKDEEAYEYL